ncbi:DUF2190 family protein [Ketogulonicigenium vulgare]|uniref:DUF2190 family protein n=1 Tax=Ketogulonicigenium vulgare (strain WSH-001) TaxID=759362 RepID=F9Y4L2_KETVW|nr:DUF2190 family protein [Ketogulonicigenium vulgare]ADO42373.1 conserved hypothetical protein [Ketogulonicigenium vulgare Y25]AEM40569.1 hypothetical protein KVU_0730 [Ketogulonicigenium vulgare WSH-001]ALJ80750.1 hypothetical protein KVH_05880 [Ketogulonicigenium vulgare]ANW33545.1 hypothetical protein KvSKV_05850 [Ketogulonicigenium vulgare]AOZ54285.1 hypothetical protein KVC_1268 [Ketogulonicigenium vulgare]
MKNSIQRGHSLAIIAAAAVESGQLVVAGRMVGVAGADADAGDRVEIHLEGVYELTKTPTQAWSVGALVYAVPATGVLTTAASGNVLVGVAVEATVNPSATGIVRLNGSFSPAAA